MVWLEEVPRRYKNTNCFSFSDSEDKVMYKNPCLSLLSNELNQLVDSLPPEAKANPGNYFIKETKETDEVRLYLKKCPPGTIQNIRKSMCELRDGVDIRDICTNTNPLTKKNQVQMLEEHIKRLATKYQQGGEV